MTVQEFDALLTKAAGLVGAMASLVFLKGPWSERVVMAISGSIVSYYAAPWMAGKTGLPEGLSGFLLGLFGMALCAKAWETLHTLPIAEAWTAILDGIRSRLGGGGGGR